MLYSWGLRVLVFLIKPHNPVNAYIIKHIFEPSQHTKEQACILDFREIGGKGSEGESVREMCKKLFFLVCKQF